MLGNWESWGSGTSLKILAICLGGRLAVKLFSEYSCLPWLEMTEGC